MYAILPHVIARIVSLCIYLIILDHFKIQNQRDQEQSSFENTPLDTRGSL